METTTTVEVTTVETTTFDTALLARFAEVKKQLEALEKEEAELKSTIMESMKAGNLEKIESEVIDITYVASFERETFDSKKFKADNPEMYDAYKKMSKVSESLKVKVK